MSSEPVADIINSSIKPNTVLVLQIECMEIYFMSTKDVGSVFASFYLIGRLVNN